ncbi:hypothetical protein [Longimicrobium terrae]|uniref:Uncharacterized protein n=1 Tax=Longimicrobium terrae TaxID=1639882 RepID=A0A841GUX1_9BACT|nr:hypothetical protein [Longimicrobium terrae]MBB4634923.1 hypothetical protein [Longimicrobium terrae]MBB6069318.1 hypothetical protein [Longimicrobium terrae]NNC31874.1 hypothetical protein [Longimicrobium terrae]
MSDFFTRQAERVLGVAHAIEPLMASRFAESAFAEGEPGFQEVHAEVERGRETVRASRPAAPRIDSPRIDPPHGPVAAGHADSPPSSTAPVLRRFVDTGDRSGVAAQHVAGTMDSGRAADPADHASLSRPAVSDSGWDRDPDSVDQNHPDALLMDHAAAFRDAVSPASANGDSGRERARTTRVAAEAESPGPHREFVPHAGSDHRDGATDRAAVDHPHDHTAVRGATADDGLLFSADRDREKPALHGDRGRATQAGAEQFAASTSRIGASDASGRSESTVAKSASSPDRIGGRESSTDRVNARSSAADEGNAGGSSSRDARTTGLNAADPSSTELLIPVNGSEPGRGGGVARGATADSGSRSGETFESRAGNGLVDAEFAADSGAASTSASAPPSDPAAASTATEKARRNGAERAGLLLPPTRRVSRRTADPAAAEARGEAAEDRSGAVEDGPSSTERSSAAAERRPHAATRLTLLPPARNARSQAAPPAAKADPERPAVTVSIGRIEVRPAPAPAPEPVVQPAAPGWRAPVLSLNDYLNKGGR